MQANVKLNTQHTYIMALSYDAMPRQINLVIW